jgi:hypothetical protein
LIQKSIILISTICLIGYSALSHARPTAEMIIGQLEKFERVDLDLNTYDVKIKSLKDAFSKIPVDPYDKKWVRQKISHMFELDQFMRKFSDVIYSHKYTLKEEQYFWKEFFPRFKELDAKNTEDLKELITIYDWFKISEFDAITDDKAWILVQHADHDPEFQKYILKKLEKLYRIGETNPHNYAYLVDRVAASWYDISKRTLQRYGTQGACIAPEKWEPIPMEDPSNVDVRRKEVGLPPLKEYIAGFKDICK